MSKLFRFIYCMWYGLDYSSCFCDVGDAIEDESDEQEMSGPCPGCGYTL